MKFYYIFVFRSYFSKVCKQTCCLIAKPTAYPQLHQGPAHSIHTKTPFSTLLSPLKGSVIKSGPEVHFRPAKQTHMNTHTYTHTSHLGLFPPGLSQIPRALVSLSASEDQAIPALVHLKLWGCEPNVFPGPGCNLF